MKNKYVKISIVAIILLLLIVLIFFVFLKKWQKGDGQLNNKNWSWDVQVTTESLVKNQQINKWYCFSIADSTEKEKCIKTMEDINKKDLELFTEATKSLDDGKCSNIQNTTDKEWCKTEVARIALFNEATKTLDLKLCEKITDLTSKETCVNIVKDWLVFNEAVAQKNQKKCTEIVNKDSQQKCIEQIKFWALLQDAIKKVDIKLCSKLSDSNYKQKCEEEINNIIIIQSAFLDWDLSKCTTIKEPFAKQKCEEEINNKKITEIAKEKKDKQECQKIESSEPRKVCERMVAEQIESSDLKMYMQQAKEKNDVSICKKITNQEWALLCSTIVTKNYDDCDKITNELFKNECYSNKTQYVKELFSKLNSSMGWKAKETNDKTLCDGYKNTFENKTCLARVNDVYYYNQALKTWNVKLCDNSTKKYIPFCKAIISKDKKYCDQLEDEKEKNSCINSVK